MAIPIPFYPALDQTAVWIAFRNNTFIADMVLPYMPVSAQLFWYNKYTISDSFNILETEVGRTGTVNEIEYTAAKIESSTIDQALDNPVPQTDIDNAPAGYNILTRGAELTAERILLRREQRVATLVTTKANYTYATTLSGTAQYNDYTNSDPLGTINTGLDTPLQRPNTVVISRPVWTTLRQHPKLVNAITGQAGVVNGRVSNQAFLDLFELQNMYVGEVRYNTAAKGQTASYSRLWGKHIALIYQNPIADLMGGGLTFGATARFGTRMAMNYFDPHRGMKGTTVQRIGESVKELILADPCAYFIENAIA